MDLCLDKLLIDLSTVSLSSQSRDNGIRTLLRIFNDILQNPTSKKYKLINAKTLQNTLDCNSKSPFFQLLFYVGFHLKRTPSGTEQLVFDENDMKKLRQTYALLSCFLDPSYSDHNQSINQHLCICGKRFIQMRNQPNTSCDACSKTIQTYSYCDNGNSGLHVGSFIVCNDCVKQCDMALQQQKHIHTMQSIQQLIDDGLTVCGAQQLITMSIDENAACDAYDDEKQWLPSPNEEEQKEHTIDAVLSNYSRCSGSKTSCNYLSEIVTVLKQYTHGNSSNDSFREYTIHILNDFNHVLYHHNGDEDFDYIARQIGDCDIKNCKIIQRHYRHPKPAVHEAHFIDKMHCYFMHSCDIGHRTRELEPQQPNISNIIDTRATKFNQIQPPKPSAIACSKAFSFGHQFYYWPAFKNQSRHYVRPKYASLKDEMTQNVIYSLHMDCWDIEVDLAKAHQQTTRAAKLVANPLPDGDAAVGMDNRLYGIPRNAPITLEHLIAIRIYCAYGVLAFKFSETYRNWDDCDTIKEFIARHSNFHHLAKRLVEACNLFSRWSIFGKITHFFHGVEEEMIFGAMECGMKQPLSTTMNWKVARTFARKYGEATGLILQLKVAPPTRYFDCSWISPYASERELLFLNSMVSIVNITRINPISPDTHLRLYVQALSIIAKVIHCSYFAMDFNVQRKLMLKYINNYNKIFTSNPAEFGAQELPLHLKKLTIQLIKHQLNKVHPDKYRKLENIDHYMEQCLHKQCLNVEVVCIKWKSMHVALTNTLQRGPSEAGYQGYSFMQRLFCLRDYQMIDLDVITALYPNITDFTLEEMSLVSPCCLDYIYQFLSSRNKTKLKKIELRHSKAICMSYSTMISEYAFQLYAIGWSILDLLDLNLSGVTVPEFDSKHKQITQISYSGIHIQKM
eukprot:146579_1